MINHNYEQIVIGINEDFPFMINSPYVYRHFGIETAYDYDNLIKLIGNGNITTHAIIGYELPKINLGNDSDEFVSFKDISKEIRTISPDTQIIGYMLPTSQMVYEGVDKFLENYFDILDFYNNLNSIGNKKLDQFITEFFE